MKTLTIGLGGFVLGAAAARLFDPRTGARRRAEVVQKSLHAAHHAADFAGKSSRDLTNRSRGLWHALFGGVGPVDDDVLVERVRSRLGRVCSHPSAIETTASGGVVELRGPVLAADYRQLLDEVTSVRGVSAVIDDLQIHERPGDVPGLQGEGRRAEPHAVDILQDSWAPATRLLAGTLGASLIGCGAARRDLVGFGIAAFGGLVLARSVANLPVKQLVEARAGRPQAGAADQVPSRGEGEPLYA
jgi:hypothetical protein